ncbi:MAG: 16S rRNA (uracil(1498)-N(3))-methyltransferase [Spirochaetaceae bacterium]|nr:16S rRNA (uracil(1498)-N(3))-methyltransferase [Spirochaetaceae bacterium]
MRQPDGRWSETEKLKQFLLRDFPSPDGRIILSGKDYHYLARVRRVKAGDVLDAALPDGSPARLTVISAEENALLCGVRVEETPAEQKREDGGPLIILLQAVPQPAKMDLLVRQATEGGVYAIVPFVSRYSFKAATFRLERWRRIVREARQQSGSPVATTVEEPRGSVDEALAYYREARTQAAARGENTAALLLHEKEKGADGSFHRALAFRPDTVFVVIGPEGGLADEETADFVQNGFVVINMGPNVLRVETAAAWAVGVVSVTAREFAFWKLGELWKS